MGASSDIRAGGAFVELYAKDNALTRGLAAAEGKLRAFGSGISALGTKFIAAGAAITAPLTAAAKLFADDGKGLLMMSRRTGIAVESLSALVQAFGGDSETLETGLRKMQKALVDAAQGGVGTTAALQRLGLTVHDLAGLSPEDQLMKIADGLQNVHDPAVKAATAMELFGKTGTQLLPGMFAGAKGIRERMAQAVADGRVMTTEEAEQATALAKAWTMLGAETRRVTTAIGSAVAPILKKTADQMRSLAKWILDLVQGHKEFFAVAFNVGKALFVVGTAMKLAGFAVNQLAGALGLLRVAINLAQNVLMAVGSAIAALLSPFGLFVVALAGAGAAWAVFTDAGQRAMSAVGNGLTVLKETVSQAAGGIRDALAAGDYALAAQILWQALKVAFKVGVNTLMNVWREFRDWFVGLAWDIAASVITAFAYLWAEIRKGARSLWEGTQEAIAKGIGNLLGVDVTPEVELRQKKRGVDAAKIDKDAREFEKSIMDTKDAEASARNREREEALKQDRERLENLRAELKALTEKAKKEKELPEPGTPAAYEGVAQGANELEDLAKRRFTVQGTFNAGAAAYMGGFGKLETIQKKQAEALKRIDENIERIRQLEERNGGMQFAEGGLMPITISERVISPELGAGQDAKATRVYTITGTAVETDALAALAIASPATYQGLTRSSLSVKPQTDDLWEGTVQYDKRQNNDTGSEVFSFDTTGATQHVNQSLNTLSSDVPAGEPVTDFGGAINVTGEAVEGIDIPFPQFAFTFTRYIANEDMTGSIIDALYRKTGRQNSDTVTVTVNGATLTFQDGELLFLGATGKPRSDDWEISMRFLAIPNEDALVLGPITVGHKDGQDYLWLFYEEAVDATSHRLVRVPKQANVEQVFHTTELQPLFG